MLDSEKSESKMASSTSGPPPAPRMPRFESGGLGPPPPSNSFQNLALRRSGNCEEKGGVRYDPSKISVNAWGTTVEGFTWTGEANVTCEVDVEPESYAEIEMTKLPTGAAVAVGFDYASDSTVVGTDTLPGWNVGTVGIHSDDGKVFCCNEDLGTHGVSGASFTFQQGDIVGAEFRDCHFLLTLNGKLQCRYKVTGEVLASRPKLLLGFDHPTTRLSLNTSGQRLLYNPF